MIDATHWNLRGPVRSMRTKVTVARRSFSDDGRSALHTQDYVRRTSRRKLIPFASGPTPKISATV